MANFLFLSLIALFFNMLPSSIAFNNSKTFSPTSKTVAMDTIIFTGIKSLWSGDDAWRSWTISTEQGDGSLNAAWSSSTSEWNFSLPGINGDIRRTWSDDREWTLNANGMTVHIKQVWSDDWHEWQISSRNMQLRLKTIWSGDDGWRSWRISDSHFGTFEIKTIWSGDDAWKSWNIDDQMPGVPPQLKMAATFIAVYVAAKLNDGFPKDD